MDTTPLTIPADWPESAQVYAEEDTAVWISKTDKPVHVAKTSTAVKPSFKPSLGHRILVDDEEWFFTLRAGERLWLSGGGKPSTATITTGAV